MASRKRIPRSAAAPARDVSSEIEAIALHLRQIRAAVALAVAALRFQNSDLDEDIACVLQRSVADRLQDQIDRLAALARRAPSPGRRTGYN